MTSQINYSAINTQYPVAGQDNDSQGFRDNFTRISAGLQEAATEISALQQNAVIVADLATSSQPVINNLLGSTLYNGLYSQFDGVFYNAGTVSSSANIDLTNGPVQKFTLAGAVNTLTFTNWGTTGSFSQIRVIIGSDQNHVSYPVFSTAQSGTIHYEVGFPTNPVTSNPGFLVGGEVVSSISVGAQGTGYTSQPGISFTGGNPLTGAISPVAVATFTVVATSVSAGGTGFANGDQLAVNGPYGIILVVQGQTGGAITSLGVSSGGTLTAPLTGVYDCTAISGAGTGAQISLSCGISAINLTNKGRGYTTTPPSVIIAGGTSGSVASGTAVLTSGYSTKVKVIDAWTVDGGANVYIKYHGEF